MTKIKNFFTILVIVFTSFASPLHAKMYNCSIDDVVGYDNETKELKRIGFNSFSFVFSDEEKMLIFDERFVLEGLIAKNVNVVSSDQFWVGGVIWYVMYADPSFQFAWFSNNKEIPSVVLWATCLKP